MFLIPSLNVGGTERHLDNIITNIDREKFNPVICCLYELGAIGRDIAGHDEEINVYHNLLRNRWDFRGALRLLSIVKNENVEILYIVNSPLTMLLGLLCIKLTQVKTAMTRITVARPVTHVFRRWIANVSLMNFIDVVIAQSDFHKEYLVNHEGFNKEQIKVVYNGVNLDDFDRATISDSFRNESAISETSPIVGVVARLSGEKGLSTFLEASKMISDEMPDVHFIIAGDGPERVRLEHLSHNLGIESKVHFIGQRHDIPQIISLFDIAVMPSDIENFSNAILEYMASAKPVIATNVGGAAEQVTDGITGFLIPKGKPDIMASSVIRLLKDRNLAYEMGNAGRKRVVEKYSVTNMISRYESIFHTMLADLHTR